MASIGFQPTNLSNMGQIGEVGDENLPYLDLIFG